MSGPSLRELTLQLIHSRDANVSLTAIASRAGVDPVWLWNFARGQTRDKSVDRIQRLFEHLTGKPLIS